MIAIGIDPGPATGIFLLGGEGEISAAYQCNGDRASWLLYAILRDLGDTYGTPCGIEAVRRGAKMLRGQHLDTTRTLVDELSAVASRHGLVVVQRSASEVKPWATDVRLERAGILGLTGHGMAHARDAGRHALYRAVHAGLIPDPLSRKWQG